MGRKKARGWMEKGKGKRGGRKGTERGIEGGRAGEGTKSLRKTCTKLIAITKIDNVNTILPRYDTW